MRSRQRPSIFWAGWVVPVLVLTLLGAIALACVGCADTNAVSAATTLEQKAYAVYGTFVIVEEQGARLVGDPNVATSVKNAVRVADARAKPAADTLVTILHQYETTAAAVKSGNATPGALNIANANLTTALTQAARDVNTLVGAVQGAAP